MTGAQEARHKLGSAPADIRFAVLFAPRTQRAALTALFAVYREVCEILHECSDANVARTKLAWWREEIDLLGQRRPRHPLTSNLAQQLADPSVCVQPLMQILASVSTDIAAPGFQQFDDLERYCEQRGGALLQLSATLAGAHSASTAAAARNFGIAWQLADLLVHTHEHAQLARVYFAVEDLHKHAVDRHIIADLHTTAGLKALLADYAQRAQAYCQTGLSQPAVEHHSLVAARVLNALAQARLYKFVRNDYATAQPPVELRPFASLWIAWNAARAAH